jgi:hypothetical protein
MGKHSAERRSAMPLVLATVAVLAIAVVVFLAVRMFNGSLSSSTATPPQSTSTTAALATTATTTTTSEPTTTTPTTSEPTTTTPTTSAADAGARAALQACVQHQDVAKRIVDTITTGATHWSDHVQGQTDIDSGARTLLDVMTNTWGPTRAAGPADVAAFQAAQGVYAGAPACPTTVGTLPAPADTTPKLQACAAREQALDAVVATGTAVMGDWNTHLSEMADHADGHINGPGAQAKWIKRWSEAPKNLDPYRAAAAALAAAPACTA